MYVRSCVQLLRNCRVDLFFEAATYVRYDIFGIGLLTSWGIDLIQFVRMRSDIYNMSYGSYAIL